VNNVLTRFGYDGAEAIHQLVGTVKTTYTYGPGLDEVLLQEQGTTALYLLRDGLNSTIAATNAAGVVVERYAYDAYGQVQVQNAARQPIATAPQTPWLFTGRYYHAESKLYDFRNRAYHPAIGRFMQMDPIRWKGLDLNLYRYVLNNPIVLRDPDGKNPWVWGAGIIALGYTIWSATKMIFTARDRVEQGYESLRDLQSYNGDDFEEYVRLRQKFEQDRATAFSCAVEAGSHVPGTFIGGEIPSSPWDLVVKGVLDLIGDLSGG